MQQCMTWVKQSDMGINHAQLGPIHSVGSCMDFSRGWAKVVDLFLAYNKVIYSLNSKPFSHPVSKCCGLYIRKACGRTLRNPTDFRSFPSPNGRNFSWVNKRITMSKGPSYVGGFLFIQ